MREGTLALRLTTAPRPIEITGDELNRLGIVIKHRTQSHVEEVSRDIIRHFACGMGDPNPIFLNEDHAGCQPGGENRDTAGDALYMHYAFDRSSSAMSAGYRKCTRSSSGPSSTSTTGFADDDRHDRLGPVWIGLYIRAHV